MQRGPAAIGADLYRWSTSGGSRDASKVIDGLSENEDSNEAMIADCLAKFSL